MKDYICWSFVSRSCPNLPVHSWIFEGVVTVQVTWCGHHVFFLPYDLLEGKKLSDFQPLAEP